MLPAAAGLAVLAGIPALAQYPGQVSDKSKDQGPQLRAVAVLEWTGDPGKPKASRIVPVTIYDGNKLQDAGLYLARPYPIALAGETEYELKQNGRTIGLFDIRNAGQVQGSWVGFGDWKSLPKPKTDAATPKIDEDEWQSDDDKPVLHRKHEPDKKPDESKAGSDKSSTTSDDPDRPKLQKKSDDSAKSQSSPDDTDHPTLHKKSDDSKTSDTSAATPDSSGGIVPDPDRPVMKKPAAQPAEKPADAEGNVSSLPDVTDPDRPRLQRGKATPDTVKLAPTLMGLPPDMQQTVAVSDTRNRPEHAWTYSWANPDDEGKMKAQLEEIARQALGIAPPTPPPAPVPKTAAARRRAAAKKAAAPPAEPAPLENEQFRVFELAYGSGATMVLTAHTSGDKADQKYVTLIAQPDLYGNVLVLLKNVTDGAHLDETPHMRLVDAVDALADNRGELLFELRGDSSRQFALYRVLRGRADKLFTSFGSNVGSPTAE